MKTPSLKPLFLERIKILLPDKKDLNAYLKILKIPPVKSIRCNTLKISPQKLKERLEKKGWIVKQPWQEYKEVTVVEGKLPAHTSSQMNEITNNLISKKDLLLSYKGGSERSKLLEGNNRAKRDKIIDLPPGELGRSIEHLLGYYYIQELASMLPILALAPKPNEKILDLTAAPGSKTTQASSLMNNTGTIIANDISLARIKILASNLERCGCSNVIITQKNALHLCIKLKNSNIKFDKILLDAPCSGEGTLRSTPKTYLMWNPKTIKSLSRLQKKLLKKAIELLKPEGEIVYSTCTHAPEENEEVIDYIIKEFGKKIEIEKINLPVKSRQGITSWMNKKFSNEIKKTLRIYPQDNNTEGFFIAKMKVK